MTIPIRPMGPGIVSPLERSGGVQSFAPKSGEPSFGDVFKRVLSDSSAMQEDAQDVIGAFLRGEPVELHQVMAASEEAAISLELLVEVRNKLTEAYRSVMSIQV